MNFAAGPLLLFGGCYSNLQATKALLARAQALGVPRRNLICTGDVIAYGADAAATLRLIRAENILTIAGNCEEALSAGAPNCGCGFAPDSLCNALAAEWYAHALTQIDEADRAYMAGLPKTLDITFKGKMLRIVHGNVERINAFVFPSVSNLELQTQIGIAGADVVIAGHSGIPFTRHLDDKIWHNPGSIGVPANDGTRRGWFSLLDVEDGEIIITPQALEYDWAAAAAAMRAKKLPEGYAAALETGIWPSLDILPAADRYFAGIPLEQREIAEPAPQMALARLETLWINTGTLCNLACTNCFMESTPTNESLAYMPLAAFQTLLASAPASLAEIGFTGGEPFMNPDIILMLEAALAAGKSALVLTNAMRPLQRHEAAIARLAAAYPGKLAIRVSLDHYVSARHEAIRGKTSFQPSLGGLRFLAQTFAKISVASRTPWGETEAAMRTGFARLFTAENLPIDAEDPAQLILFPEMDEASPALKVTQAALDAAPPEKPLMCATSRMAVLRKGEATPRITPCTLLPNHVLPSIDAPIALDHPHCAQFCVYGGASCAGAPG
jgi:predicted phosphodiesterase/pyruvate-formate lyase-activating enzyme